MRSKMTFLLAAALGLFSPLAFGKGTEVKFHGTVTKVEVITTVTGNVTVHIVGFDVVVKVTADTDIVQHGDKVGLAGLKVNDFVKVEGFFSSSGIVGEEIQILDDTQGSFRLRGPITAVSTGAGGTTITLLGLGVLVDSNTKIERRGPGGAGTVADLKVGEQADATGTEKNGAYVATRVKVGFREDDAIRVEFDGKITSYTNPLLNLDTGGGGAAVVLVGPSTVVKGTLAVGKSAKVKGTLNALLQVVAERIIVEGSEDEDHHEGHVGFKKEVTLGPVAAGILLRGSADVEYDKNDDGKVKQDLKVEIEKADPSTEYRVMVVFGAAGTVDFGPIVSDQQGKADVKFSSDPHGDDRNLTPLLPAGKSVQDITKVQVTNAAKTVLVEGTF